MMLSAATAPAESSTPTTTTTTAVSPSTTTTHHRSAEDGTPAIIVVAAAKQKKPYKELNLEEKVCLIRMAEDNPRMSQAELAKIFGIAKSNVCRVLKRRLEYVTVYQTNNFSGARKRKLRDSDTRELNVLVAWWLKSRIKANEPVNGPLIQEKAREIAQLLHVPNFVASNGWLQSFQKSYFSQKILSGNAELLEPPPLTAQMLLKKSDAANNLLERFKTMTQTNINNNNSNNNFGLLLPGFLGGLEVNNNDILLNNNNNNNGKGHDANNDNNNNNNNNSQHQQLLTIDVNNNNNRNNNNNLVKSAPNLNLLLNSSAASILTLPNSFQSAQPPAAAEASSTSTNLVTSTTANTSLLSSSIAAPDKNNNNAEAAQSNETLRAHMYKQHQISRMFMCRCCNWAFPDKTSLHIHMQSMANGDPGNVSIIAKSSTSPSHPGNQLGNLEENEWLDGEENNMMYDDKQDEGGPASANGNQLSLAAKLALENNPAAAALLMNGDNAIGGCPLDAAAAGGLPNHLHHGSLWTMSDQSFPQVDASGVGSLGGTLSLLVDDDGADDDDDGEIMVGDGMEEIVDDDDGQHPHQEGNIVDDGLLPSDDDYPRADSGYDEDRMEDDQKGVNNGNSTTSMGLDNNNSINNNNNSNSNNNSSSSPLNSLLYRKKMWNRMNNNNTNNNGGNRQSLDNLFGAVNSQLSLPAFLQKSSNTNNNNNNNNNNGDGTTPVKDETTTNATTTATAGGSPSSSSSGMQSSYHSPPNGQNQNQAGPTVMNGLGMASTSHGNINSIINKNNINNPGSNNHHSNNNIPSSSTPSSRRTTNANNNNNVSGGTASGNPPSVPNCFTCQILKGKLGFAENRSRILENKVNSLESQIGRLHSKMVTLDSNAKKYEEEGRGLRDTNEELHRKLLKAQEKAIIFMQKGFGDPEKTQQFLNDLLQETFLNNNHV